MTSMGTNYKLCHLQTLDNKYNKYDHFQFAFGTW